MNTHWRHGDISGHRISALPDGLKEVAQNGSFVLAEGETTGHKHCITATPKTMRVLQGPDGRFYLDIQDSAEISHEEHKTIFVQPGIYEVRHEQEYDWFAHKTRRVID